MGTFSKLKGLAGRAGKWLGLAQSPPTAPVVGAVRDDKFDQLAWRDVVDQAPAIRDLIEELSEQYDYAQDIVRDTFLGAYKAAPELRDREEMAPSRRAAHAVVAGMLSSPELAELRRETAGDPYAAAMATLAMADTLRETLQRTQSAAEQGRQAESAAAELDAAAADVERTLIDAGEVADQDGNVPEDQATAVAAAIDAAEQAETRAQAAQDAADQSAEQAGAAVRAALRRALAQAEQEVREEAELMAAWGVTEGQLERMSFAERADLARRLRSGRMARYADLIGRFRLMASAARKRKLQHVAGELVGVTLGTDLGALIPAEAAALAVPGLRADLLARFVAGQVMVYETEGEENADRGGIVAMVDCSASMTAPQAAGVSGEAWGKAFALALLDQARATRPTPRDFACVLFASRREIKVFHFPGDRDVPIGEVIEMTEHFFNGGTDFAAPIDAATSLLEAEFTENGRVNGDLVLITDGESGVTEEWMRAHQERKARLGFTLYGVSVAGQIGPVLDALSDNAHTITELTAPDEVRDLFAAI
jgi:uncharacterized protein with von Willebrand factor type A (vWA) domain